MRPIGTFIVFTVFGTLAPALCMFLYYAYDLMSKGITRDLVPPKQLLLQEMGLHTVAIYGAIGGATIGLLVAIYEGVSIWRERRQKVGAVQEDDGPTPDELIRTDQIRIADGYMASRGNQQV